MQVWMELNRHRRYLHQCKGAVRRAPAVLMLSGRLNIDHLTGGFMQKP